MAKIVAYYRKTKKGTSLAEQKRTLAEFADRRHDKVVGDFTEDETADSVTRPELQRAAEQAGRAGATLVVAEMKGLTRNVPFLFALRDMGVDCTACDLPSLNKASLHTMAEVAEQESMAASRRTKDSLAAAKAAGKKLGSARPGHWSGRENKRGWKKGAKNSAAVRSKKARAAYAFLLPTIQSLRKEDKSYDAIAAELNEQGHTTTGGSQFTGTAIWRILKMSESA